MPSRTLRDGRGEYRMETTWVCSHWDSLVLPGGGRLVCCERAAARARPEVCWHGGPLIVSIPGTALEPGGMMMPRASARRSPITRCLRSRLSPANIRRPEMCQIAHARFADAATLDVMSERNGDRARYHKDRKRKLHRRQRIQAFIAALRRRADEKASTDAASLDMQDEGGPSGLGD